MTFRAPRKDPDAILDYSVDWTSWLATGESVSTHTVTVPSGITLVSSALASDVVTFRLSGGTAGSRYDVVVHVAASNGEEDDRTMTVEVNNR